jgi:hypothetical protein
VSAPRAFLRPEGANAELAFLLSYVEPHGEVPLYIDGLPKPLHHLRCADPKTPQRVARMACNLDFYESVEVALGLACTQGHVYSAPLLWAWIRGGEQEQRAAKFRPLPSLVLRIGSSSERLLGWTLKHPVAAHEADLLNARLAYALHAPRTRSKCAALRLPLPGTFMRVGRSQPAPVLVTRWQIDRPFDAAAIAGDLREPPAPDAWRQRRR